MHSLTINEKRIKQSTNLTPLVSVIIPAYNAENFITTTLESVLSQTYKNFEVLVIDDGSQDTTAEIVKCFAQKDSRVTLLQQENFGVAAARNLGINQSQGEFIAPIDADDIWYPQNLEKQVQCLLQADTSVGLVYSWSVDINEQGKLTGNFRASSIEGDVFTTLLCHNFLGNASSTLIRRSCIEKIGVYNCELKAQNAQGCEDWDFYLRIAEHFKFKVIPEFCIGYRKIANTMSGDYKKMAKSHDLMLKEIQTRHRKIPTIFYRLSRSSFYMYLARQSNVYNNHHQALYWLSQALKVDFITPFFRIGLYTLTIKSLFGLIASNQDITIDNFDKRRLGRIYFQLFVGRVFHRLSLSK
ncbi:glycosyltransferase family A protein [Rivularia sp. PCC 7116]|uniref:glycosyltransferase family 2 protein n=1 Tax=Rivularia sp. PCC 7116 TaxID=373994 RepID=UPI0012FA3E9D|nr:glycosyltransferase family A protein [Rivularia sp. PCC 7116]